MAAPPEVLVQSIDWPAGRPEAAPAEMDAPTRGVPGLCRAGTALALALLAFFALSCSGNAQQLLATGGRPNNPLLWRVEAPGEGGGTLYLLGSVHMGTPAMQDLGPVVSEAFERTEELVVEVDLSNLDPVETAVMMQRHGSLSDGVQLRDVIRPETHALLTGYLDQRGLPGAAFETMKPWWVSTLVAVMGFEDAGLDGRLGVDQAFIDRAGEKPIVPLETFESQLAMLSGLDWEVQDLMLEDSLLKSGEMALHSEMIVESWRLGDEAELERILFEDLEATPALEPLYQVMFYDRNERMAELLVELSRDGIPRFVVLGAGHMVGSRGIPALLTAAGFRVEQIGGRNLERIPDAAP
jgi:uncharacterized protein YbaP (TraB family)